jgi:hypothetical protein
MLPHKVLGQLPATPRVVHLEGRWCARRLSIAPSPMITPDAAHLSLVVLPFTNLSNDPSQDYFIFSPCRVANQDGPN